MFHWWNWHKRWPLRDLLCKLERHDYEHPRVVAKGILLTCFYCEHQKLCLGAQTPQFTPGEWRGYQTACEYMRVRRPGVELWTRLEAAAKVCAHQDLQTKDES